MPRTAALLCIQNAAASLGWWIAHHVAVGFSTLLICDDHSSDGSVDLLTQAAQQYDIRISSTDEAITDTYERRQNALSSLVQREASDLEWVIPLSIDEYVQPEASSIAAMLHQIAHKIGYDRFQRTATIPLNWCLTGLNSFPPLETIDQPSPRALYMRHAPHNFPDHRITRSFFRPDSTSHARPDPYAHLNTPPDWSFGRIIHDAALTSSSKAARHYYDRNDVAYYDGCRFINASQRIASTLLHTLLLHQTRRLRTRASDIPSKKNISAPLEHHYIGSLERFLVIEHQTHRVVWRESASFNAKHETRLCLTTLPPQSPNHGTRPAWLYAEDALSLSYLPLNAEAQRFSHLLDILPLTLTHSPDGAELCLAHHPEKIMLDGQSLFPLFPLRKHNPTYRGPLQALEALTRYGFSAPAVQYALQTMPWNAPSALAAVSVHLPAEEASQLLSPYLMHLFHGHSA